MPPIPRESILGVGVSAINMDLALATLDQWVQQKTPRYVCVSGVHGVMESQRSNELRRIHNDAGLVTPDGMPLVWLLRATGHKHAGRVYGPDLMLALLEQSCGRGYSHFFYGASNKALTLLQSNMADRFPGLNIAGAFSPPFRPLSRTEDEEVVERINESGADVVWVGLSTPKQEQWMAAHRARLRAPVLIGVGAAFDFHAGLVRQAPRILQRSGLEWAFRMAMEPRRLWRRYMTNNPLFVLLILGQALNLKKYSLEN